MATKNKGNCSRDNYMHVRRKGYHLLLPYGVTASDPVGSVTCGRTHLIQISTPSFLLQMRMDGYSTKMVAIPSTGKTLRYNRKLRVQLIF